MEVKSRLNTDHPEFPTMDDLIGDARDGEKSELDLSVHLIHFT